MFYFVILAIAILLAYNYYNINLQEDFTCYPDIFDEGYHTMKTNHFVLKEAEKLLSRNPKYINKTIVPMNQDLANTVYLSAYSKDSTLVGYVKMIVSEKFMANLIDVGFYEQELFGFSGWYGYHIYELVAFDEEIALKLMKRAIHHLKQDGNRYYLSILCLTEPLAKTLMHKFKFALTLKEQSKRFYEDTLYTLVYYK